MANYTVTKSRYISSLEEARDYYQRKLARAHRVDCHGRGVTVVFEQAATHLFSVEAVGKVSPELRVRRWLSPTKFEDRKFDLERARSMDDVLIAITHFTVSVPGTANSGHEKRLLHGPRLQTGNHLRVVLRPGPGDAFTCVSAYEISHDKWMEMRRSKAAKFPP